MILRLITEYVNKITLNDVYNFANQNGIFLKNIEAELIFNYIKNDWYTLIYGNPQMIFNDIKNKIDYETYTKVEQLYFYFKEKYKNYL
ncbi:MAG: DUF2624 family protein [Bacilli bacterium]